MSRYEPSKPRPPSFDIGVDRVAIVLQLICHGCREARAHISADMLEPDINRWVWQSMRRIKEDLGFCSVEVYGEFPVVPYSELGQKAKIRKPDIVLKFFRHFGNEDAYVAIECKRVDPNDNTLNRRYVTKGVDRFATGKYAKHHRWAFMLGYMLALPADRVIAHIDAGIQKKYGLDAALKKHPSHQHSLAIFENAMNQRGAGQIRVMHVFVDMS